MSTPEIRRVMVTGAGGNLGLKVVEALARTDWCERIVGIDRSGDATKYSETARERLTLVKGDLTVRGGEWADAMREVDAVIHFAALNPLPDSSWQQALASYAMTQNVVLEAVRGGVGRFVFASSNHAMGAYKDAPLATQMGPGKLRTDLPPAPGTRWHDGTHEIHSFAYGSAKVLGERFCEAATELAGDGFSTVAVRVGWALTGDNHPRDITHSGSPASSSEMAGLDDDGRRALRWFRNMWLSNHDLGELFIRSVRAPATHWPSRSVIVNGVSNNRGMDWDLSSAEAWLGYTARDDAYAQLDAEPAPR